jgi:hypothetical protein
MSKLKKSYYYLFYKLYRFLEAAPSKWQSDWNAELLVDVFVFFLFVSIGIYYNVFVDRYFDFGSKGSFVLFFILISVPNYFIFHHTDRWKRIVKEFDRLPKRKNIIGGWIVFILILLIIGNLIFAFYQMSKIDWAKYR